MAPPARHELIAFMRDSPYAVQASIAAGGMSAQAAVVGVVVSDEFEVFFDTLASSRKLANLRREPGIAFVFGSTAAGALRTLQFEGVADEPAGRELDVWLERYFERFPDGRSRQGPDIAYVRVRPRWMRYSDYSHDPPQIVELDEQALAHSKGQPD